MRSCSWNPPMSQLATKRKIHKSSKHLSLDYFLSLHTVVQSAWLVLFNLPMCVRKRSWIDLPFTLSKPQLGSPLVVVNSKWLPLLAVSPFSPTCWSSLPSHFSLMTSQPSAPCLFLHSCSLFAGSNSVFALELPWIMLPTFLHPEKLLTPRRTVSGQRPCRAKCLGSDSICPGCSGSGFLSQLRIPTHIFCRQNSSEHKGYPASPSHLSCAWLTAHSQPWCCAKSSHRDFRTNTLLSPTLEHPLVLPVAPAYLHIIYGSALPASLRVSLLHRSERKPYRLCPSQQWCVHSAFATTDLPSAWKQQLVERGSSSVSSASWYQWGWLCDHSRLGLLKVSVSVLLRALCYHCVLPCAARLQLLNLEVEKQQAASWQDTFCSFLVYLSIPNDQVLGNNWHLPDLAMFCTTHKWSFFKWKWIYLELLLYPNLLGTAGSLCSGLSLFNLCIKTLSKQPSCCPHQRKKPLKGAVPIWIFPAQVRGETGQQESIRQQDLLSFKKKNFCQSQWLPTCEAMQSSSCCALNSAETSGCSNASLGTAAPSPALASPSVCQLWAVSASFASLHFIEPKICRAKRRQVRLSIECI